jgi:hypothetical protein
MATQGVNFDFITDEEFRRVLEMDYRELETCTENSAWKAVHVLAGSIVEAVLVDYLVGQGQKSPDPLTMTLADLIAACKKAGVLSQRTADLSSALKSYRNLIHPGRSKRLNESADSDGALVARSLVSIILKEVAAKQQEQYGLTAEQIVNKFESDPSALGISRHLLKDASDKEIERLLVKVLPDRYFEELQGEYARDTVLLGHSKLFRAAFEVAEEGTKRKVMARYVSVLKEEPGPSVQVYEEEFFRGSDLEYVDEAERGMVKAHLFARLKDEPNRKLIAAAVGIGRWLESDDVEPFVDPLVRTAVSASDGRLALSARALLSNAARQTPADLDPEIVQRLKDWEGFYEEREAQLSVDVVKEIRERYEVFGFLPES